MYSKSLELGGLAVVAVAVGTLAGTAYGLLAAGLSMLFVGSLTNDAAVGAAVRRGAGWVRYAFFRQLHVENGWTVPDVASLHLPKGWVACECNGDEDCPLCAGTGAVPDPNLRVNPNSPHPPLRVDPQAKQFWERMGNARKERSKLRDLTPALSRQDYAEGGDLERVG